MKETTDFINAETGEVLGFINTYLDVLGNPEENKLAMTIAAHLVRGGCAPENYNKPILVVTTQDAGDGRTLRATTIFKHLLERADEEEDENEEEEE